MNREKIKSWLKTNSPEVVFEVQKAAAEAFSKLPIEDRKFGAELVLLELEILVYEWNKNRKRPEYVEIKR
jgi:hypothetical protein